MTRAKIIPEFDHVKFLSMIRIDQGTGCWNWAGFDSGRGYGGFCINKRNFRAHRISYELFVGKLELDLVIDHICRNRACCNPDHLRQVDKRTNALENSEAACAIHAAKTHCPKGHEYNEINTRWHGTNRHCRACQREYNKERYSTRRAFKTDRSKYEIREKHE